MPLIIIESPNKVKKFVEYTGYQVFATSGHIRDLHPGGMNVDLETYEPDFEIIPGKEKNVAKLRDMAKGQRVLIATDPDREGEAISAMVEMELRGLYKDVFRVEVREITKSAITTAIANAVPFADINHGTFNAFKGRRITDRLVGYTLSPKASNGLNVKGLSIGRVQSVALRLVVEREREIRAHKAMPYWLIAIEVAKDGCEFIAYHTDGRFYDLSKAQEILDRVIEASYAICIKVEKQQKKNNPRPPFTTASLQMAASSRLGLAPERTMTLSQQLFEAGLISYHRTDSSRISDEIIENIRLLVTAEYGKECVPPKPIKHVAKASQSAHEGIRPTSIFPIANARKLLIEEGLKSEDHQRLYELIWKRTIASQMASAIYELTTVSLEVEQESFKGVGRTLVFDGHHRVYSVEDEEVKKTSDDHDQLLPYLEVEDLLAFREEMLIEKKTKAPPRYSEAGLIEKLESIGVGRPSTYATILGSITRRSYVEIKKRMLHPTSLGEKLFDWAAETCAWVLDYEMTRDMEEALDQVEAGEVDWKSVVREIHGKMGYAKPDLSGNDGEGGGAPSEKQVRYAEQIAKTKKVELSDKTIKSRKELSAWIGKNKPKEGEGTTKAPNLSEKQMRTINRYASKSVKDKVAAGDIKVGKVFLDVHFKKG